MIRELKPNGRAFVVVPDGFLYRPSDAELRRFLREQCTLDAIVSLPEKTFYTTTKKTYMDITGFAGHVEMTYTTIKRGRVHIG